jgi:adenosylmethionine-8-amino-7-oxononanoate aminotransferase
MYAARRRGVTGCALSRAAGVSQTGISVDGQRRQGRRAELSNVFHRTPNPLRAVGAEGCFVYDSDGRRYLDAAGGAIVVNVGHGDPEVVAALQSASILDYAHPSVFTSEAVESYAAELAPHVPIDNPRVFPASGGAESVETALKLTRAFHLARGEPDRDVVISRHQSYHGNTLGALDVSGRPSLKSPYRSWLGRARHVPEVSEYRCPSPSHPQDCGQWHADLLETQILDIGSGRVAAFIGEAVGGAALGVAPPPPDYWTAVHAICRRHGVLLVVDEVMTGFGRTGKWFGIEHYGVSPDIIVAGKGAAGGYWPLGLCISSGEVHDVVMAGGGFVHGFTFSHSPIGASVGRAVLRRLEDGLVDAAARLGYQLLERLSDSLGEIAIVGDVRGSGLLIGVEFVADRTLKKPFSRQDRVAERVAEAARERQLLVYPSSGCADGIDGDAILLGPPFIIGEEEMAIIVESLTSAIRTVAG